MEDIYWNIGKTLTHNRLINVIVGNRGGGKTYGAKKKAIDNFIEKGERFVYVRRYEKDIKKALDKSAFFRDIYARYPDYQFKSDMQYLYIREKPDDPNEKWTEDDIAGYAFVLSTANNLKSVSYPDVTLMIYDEFLLDKGMQHYLNDEPVALLNLYETIARPGTEHPRVILFMLANAITITNPYFLYWDLKMPTRKDKNGKWIWKHPTRPILVEDVKNEAFIERKKQTEFGALIAGTSYADYSIENKFFLDDSTFLEKRSPNSRYYFTFTYKEKDFGVWADFNEGLFYVSDSVDPDAAINYSITMKDHKPNTMFLKNRQNARAFKLFIENYQLGNVRFENMQIKNICYEVIKLAMSI